MAGKIQGITIKLKGDTTELQASLNDVNKRSKDLTSELKKVETSLKFNPGNVELLAQKQRILAETVENTKEKLDLLKEAQAQAADELARGEIGQKQYDELRREVIKTEDQLKRFEKQSADVAKELKNAETPMKKLGDSAGKLSKKAEKAGKAFAPISAAAGALAGAATVAAIKTGDDLTGALRDLQSQTGMTDDEMANLEESIRDIYAGGYGEGYEDIADSMSQVRQQTGFLGDELEDTTQNALLLRDTFDWEVNEQMRAVTQLMEYFGVSSEEAFNLLAQGAQNGLDQNDNLLDTINEYSPAFEEMGFSAEEMFNSLVSGAEAGIFDIDKLGDAINEFSIRATDGSDTTAEAFESLGFNAQELSSQFAAGGDSAQDAFQRMVEALAGVEDPLEQNRLGVALFGTMWEDTGSKAMLALGETQGAITATGDTLADIDASAIQTLAEKFEQIKRTVVEELLPPLQEALMPVLDSVADKVQELATWIGTLDPVVIQMGIGFLGVVAAVTPLLLLFAKVTSAISILAPVIGGISAPIGIAIAAFAALVAGGVLLYKNWDTVKQKATELKAWISEKWGQIKEAVSGAIAGAASAVSTKAQEIATAVQTKFENARKWATDKIEALKSGVTLKFESAKSAVSDKAQSIATTIRDKFDNARQSASEKFDAIKTAVTEKMEAAKTAASQKADQLKEAAVKAFEGLRQGAKDKIDAAKKAITDGIESARQAVAGYVTRFKSVGTEIINGIASGIRNGIRAVTDAARNVAKRALDAAKNFLGIRSPSKKMKKEVGEMITEGMADGIVAKKADVGKAMQDITDHVLKNIEPLTETFEREGMLMEEVFANLKQGGTVAMEELFNTMALLQDYGYDSTEMARIFGPAWSEALQMIVWNMTGWDVQTMRTTYNLDEMNKAFAAMLGVGTSGTEGMKADLEDLGTTAEAVAKQSEKAILQHLGTLKAYVAGNKAAFIASMDQLLGAGEDVWNNIVHGGSGANGVIASVINRLSGISDEAKRTALAGQAFGDHWKSALNGMIQEVGMWQSEYNVGSWAIDQNKLLSLSLEEVKAAADKVKESISAESFAEPIKEDAIKTVKDKMKDELSEIESFTKETLDGIAKDFDDTFEKIRATVAASLKEKVIPAMRDAFKLGLDASDEFNQFVFDDFNHTFYELRDVIVVNLRNHVTPALKAQLETMLRVMESYTQGFFNSGLGWMRALAQGIRSGMVDVGAALNALPKTEGGGGVQWYDKGGIFKSPTVIGVGEKRPEFVGALDDLKEIVAEVIDRKGVSTAEGVVITGNTFNVRTDDDIRRIAEELQRLSDRNKRGGN